MPLSNHFNLFSTQFLLKCWHYRVIIFKALRIIGHGIISFLLSFLWILFIFISCIIGCSLKNYENWKTDHDVIIWILMISLGMETNLGAILLRIKSPGEQNQNFEIIQSISLNSNFNFVHTVLKSNHTTYFDIFILVSAWTLQ